ncbi:uncharacterized protein G2W53_043638 [Senna tora]|uniref:Uncharacterized protein n=1 Tax=Senna tora TaxID=362788 RepID=A0A834SP92_9FABA|nr:uncharacterized protein G2W53_043638 [Senna tora]
MVVWKPMRCDSIFKPPILLARKQLVKGKLV